MKEMSCQAAWLDQSCFYDASLPYDSWPLDTPLNCSCFMRVSYRIEASLAFHLYLSLLEEQCSHCCDAGVSLSHLLGHSLKMIADSYHWQI